MVEEVREEQATGGPILRAVEIKPPRKVCKFEQKPNRHTPPALIPLTRAHPPPFVRPNLVTSLARTARPKTH